MSPSVESKNPSSPTSVAIEQRRPITEVAHLLGHKSPAITLSVYSHWFKDVKTDAMAGLAKLVCEPTDEKVVASRSSAPGKACAPRP